MPEDAKIVAIGPRAEMLGLRGIGVELIAVDDREEMLKALRKQAKRAAVRLIILSETVAVGARQQVQDVRAKNGTAILLVPSHRGSEGIMLDWMREAMEQSIGVDVISE